MSRTLECLRGFYSPLQTLPSTIRAKAQYQVLSKLRLYDFLRRQNWESEMVVNKLVSLLCYPNFPFICTQIVKYSCMMIIKLHGHHKLSELNLVWVLILLCVLILICWLETPCVNGISLSYNVGVLHNPFIRYTLVYSIPLMSSKGIKESWGKKYWICFP